MLEFVREVFDGKYRIRAETIDPATGMNKISVTDTLADKVIKKYFTDDDEAAIALFQTILDVYDSRGEMDLVHFDHTFDLPGMLVKRIQCVVGDEHAD